MDIPLPRTLLGVEDLLPGDFACAIFSDAARRTASVRPFLAAGLCNNEKILFLFDGDFGGGGGAAGPGGTGALTLASVRK